MKNKYLYVYRISELLLFVLVKNHSFFIEGYIVGRKLFGRIDMGNYILHVDSFVCINNIFLILLDNKI